MKTKLFLLSLVVVMFAACENPDDPTNPMNERASAEGSAKVSNHAGRTSCEYVQLWAGGPKWAKFNVGAIITDYAQHMNEDDNPNQASYNTAILGGLYAWNNPNLNGRDFKDGYLITGNDTIIWSVDIATGISDIASALWGNNWKTPTKDQLSHLQDKTYTTWTWCDGSTTQYVEGCTLKGYKVSGKGVYADLSIFLPAAGYIHYSNGEVADAGNIGNYWSASEADSNHAYYLHFSSYDRNITNYYYRCLGRSVRAVLAE